jgi:hypothetical protein
MMHIHGIVTSCVNFFHVNSVSLVSSYRMRQVTEALFFNSMNTLGSRSLSRLQCQGSSQPQDDSDTGAHSHKMIVILPSR